MTVPVVPDVDLRELRREYVDALGGGDRRRATQLAIELLYRGIPAEAVLTDLVGTGQVEAGLAWQDGRWTIAQEHRASAVAEAVIQAVVQQAWPPVPAAGARRGPVAVVSAEGEWHVLPGRLVSEVLRLRGFDVDYIGPSIPAGDLAGLLRAGSAPRVVAVSCSMSSSLIGAWRTITALRAAGRVIVCGGRGFGPEGVWGLALGADLGAADLDSGIALLTDALARPVGSPRPDAVAPGIAAEIALASREFAGVVAAATHLAVARRGQGGDHTWAREARGMLTFTLRTVLAAALTGDDRIVVEHARWAESVLEGRSLPVELAAEAFTLLATAMPADLPRCLAAARAGRSACRSQPARTAHR